MPGAALNTALLTLQDTRYYHVTEETDTGPSPESRRGSTHWWQRCCSASPKSWPQRNQGARFSFPSWRLGLLPERGAIKGLRHTLQTRKTMSREGSEEGPLRFSQPGMGSSHLWGKKPLSLMAHDSDLGSSVAREPHALPEMALLPPPQACPPTSPPNHFLASWGLQT